MANLTHLLFRRGEWDKLIADAVQPFITDMFKDGGAAASDLSQAIGIVGMFDVDNPEAQKYIERYTFDRIKDINATSADRYGKIISQGLKDGQTHAEIRQAILDDPILGMDGDKRRAETIARTETARAEIEGHRYSLSASNDYAAENGLAEPFVGMRFVPSPDCCDFCASFEGEEDMGGNLDLPHPSCRCTWDVILNEAYR
jgi:hypothetical protein